MATLTSDEQKEFTADQLTEIAKMSESRLIATDKYLEARTPEYYRSMRLGSWKAKTAIELRAIACFKSAVHSNSSVTITWADECDLTATQKTYVEDMIGTVDKSANQLIVEAIGGALSTNQRLTALES